VYGIPLRDALARSAARRSRSSRGMIVPSDDGQSDVGDILGEQICEHVAE
jgi:hypothetical protein